MSFADKLSITRIILIPLFVALLVYATTRPFLLYLAVGVFGIAVLSDFFDGLVARLKNEKSKIGEVIDPLADKLLLLTAFISLYLLRHSLGLSLPAWVVLVVVSRDLIILLGVGILTFLKIETKISPSVWGKLTTFFQMLTILSVMLRFKFAPVIWSVAVFFTVVSGIGYLARGIHSINVADTGNN